MLDAEWACRALFRLRAGDVRYRHAGRGEHKCNRKKRSSQLKHEYYTTDHREKVSASGSRPTYSHSNGLAPFYLE